MGNVKLSLVNGSPPPSPSTVNCFPVPAAPAPVSDKQIFKTVD